MNKKILIAAILSSALLISLVAAIYFWSPENGHRTLTVPDNYATISWAVNNATAGDTVFVKSGTYNESLVIRTPLSLIGEDSSNTIIIGGHAGIRGGGSTIDIETDNVTVSGFTLRSYNFETPAWYFHGIYIGANNTKIAGNIIENCYSGIFSPADMSNVTSINISNNTIRNNLQTGIVFGGSPFLINITDNDVTSNSFGIVVSYGYRCVIFGNSLSANSRGAIEVSGVRMDIKENNLTSNPESSINVFGSSDLVNTWNNRIENSKAGISLSDGGRQSVGGNIITNCSDYGISFFNQTGTSSIVFKNNITDNTVGISFSQSEASFYRNNFIDNGRQVVIGISDKVNYWDSGSGGNYWSDYVTMYPDAVEVDSTGIWNAPYFIDANNLDRFPLVTPFQSQ